MVIENWKQYKNSFFYNFNCKIAQRQVCVRSDDGDVGDYSRSDDNDDDDFHSDDDVDDDYHNGNVDSYNCGDDDVDNGFHDGGSNADDTCRSVTDARVGGA